MSKIPYDESAIDVLLDKPSTPVAFTRGAFVRSTKLDQSTMRTANVVDSYEQSNLTSNRLQVWIARNLLPVSVRSPYILNVYRRALRNYVPRQYTGRVVLFKGESRPDIYLHHWRKYLLGEITIHDLPGNHMQLREEPYIHLWAEKLKACLAEAQAAKTSGSGNLQSYPQKAAANPS